MAQVLIRDLRPEVVARLKARARRHRRSLQAELLDILAQASGQELSHENARRWIGSGLPMEDLLAELNSPASESVAIIGHEPHISSRTSALVAGGKLHFLPATIACVRFDGPIREGQGLLEWMLSPKQFHG